MKTIGPIPWRFWTAAVILAHFSILLLLNLSRHWGFMTSINDLGVADQIVWGLTHGQGFLNTSQLSRSINWLGFHFQPIYVGFVPLYFFLPSVFWFALAHALSLSLSAWPIYLLAHRLLGSEKIGFWWAVVFLCHPTVLNTGAFDFSPNSLVVPFVAIGFLAVETRRRALLLGCSLLILMCKEHLGLLVIGFGFLWWIRHREKVISFCLVGLGFAHLSAVLGFLMPHFSDTHAPVMFGDGLGTLSRYDWLGKSAGQALRTVLLHPIQVLVTIIMKLEGGKYLALLFSFFLGFPLVAPAALLPAAADLAVNLLSTNPMQRSLFSFHNVVLAAILTAGAIHGVKNIARLPNIRFRNPIKQLSALALATGVISGYLLAPFPLPGARNLYNPVHFFNGPDPAVEKIRFLLGPGVSASIQANVGPHFSQRKDLVRFPSRLESVDAVVLRLESPTRNIERQVGDHEGLRKYTMNLLDGHLQMDRTEFLTAVETLLQGDKFGVLFWNDPWLVLMRDRKDRFSRKGIMEKIEALRLKWS